jgi:multisubunit Na+/H+ antiporter MnhF subunit
MSRQIVLRLMLVILGIAAALAIYSIFQSSETSWRIVGTAFTLAVTIGLIVPFVPADAGQRVDLLQRTVIGHWTLGGGLVIGVIWTDMLVGRSSTEELLGIWALAGNPALLVAAIAMRSRRKQDRSLARAENIAIIGAFASFGAAVLTEQVSNAMGIDDALRLGFVLLGGTVMMAMSAFGLRAPSTDRFAPILEPSKIDAAIAVIGVCAAGAWSAFGALEVISDALNAPGGFRTTMDAASDLWLAGVAAAAVSLPCGIASVLGISRVQGPMRWVGHFAIASAGCLGALNAYQSLMAIVSFEQWRNPVISQINGALVISSAVALVASLVVMRLHRGRTIADGPIERIDWACPRCAMKAPIAPGEHTCAACGLSVAIALRDDRCPKCGYDLHAQPLDARNCPECGRERQVTALTSA